MAKVGDFTQWFTSDMHSHCDLGIYLVPLFRVYNIDLLEVISCLSAYMRINSMKIHTVLTLLDHFIPSAWLIVGLQTESE